MPLYAYTCSACKETFRRVTSVSNPDTICPHCGGVGIKDLPDNSTLIDTPSSNGRKLARQFDEKNRLNRQKQGLSK